MACFIPSHYNYAPLSIFSCLNQSHNFKLAFSSPTQIFCLELKMIWMNMSATLAAKPEHPNPGKRHKLSIASQMPSWNSSFLII